MANKMKKLLHVFLLLLTVFVITGCDEKQKEEPKEPVYTITLDKTSGELVTGEELTLVATVKKDGVTVTETVTWASSDTAVATVNNGEVTAVKAGEATITATSKGKSANFLLTVTDPVIEEVFLLLNVSTQNIKVGNTYQLVATLTDGSTPALTWTTSDDTIVSVADGLVTALKAGSAVVTVTTGELSAQAVITVTDTVELIFPALPETVLVGETIDLGVIVKRNGIEVEEDFTVTGTGFTTVEGAATILSDGPISITVTFQGVEVQRNMVAFIPVYTASDLSNIKNKLTGYYQLQNDLVIGGTFYTIAHYNDGNTGSTGGFMGYFDGNNKTISDFTPRHTTTTVVANNSLFGSIGNQGVVKNLNLINVTIDQRIGAPLATMNYGLIENVFVDAYIQFDTASEMNNPNGGIVSKNLGTMRNVVSYVRFAPNVVNTINIGGIAGRTYGTSIIENAFTIGAVGLVEEAMPNFDGNRPDLGSFTNSKAYTSIAAFYADANLATFGTNWTLTEGVLPHLNGFETSVNLTVENTVVYTNTTVELTIESDYAYEVYLKTPIVGVSISQAGILAIAKTVESETITVVLKSLFDSNAVVELELTVEHNVFEVESNDTEYTVTNYEKLSMPDAFIIEHGVMVSFNGEPYTGEIIYRSSNPKVALVDDTTIQLLDDGKTTITVVVKDDQQVEIVLLTIEVTHNYYLAVETKSDFIAIGASMASAAKKYYLANDIDFEGDNFFAFSSYRYAADLVFAGIFDGMDHTIYNLKLEYNPKDVTDSDLSIFGYISKTGVVRNLNVINVYAKDRSGVISSWNEGLIENIYLEVTYGTPDATKITTNNPAGMIASKTRAGSLVRNVVVVATFEQGTTITNVGGVIGQNFGELSNAYLITTGEVNLVNSNNQPVNSMKYATVEAFYTAAVQLEGFVFESGYMPHRGEMAQVEVMNTELKALRGTIFTLIITPNFGYTITLAEEIVGVVINGNRITIPSDLAVDTIPLLITSKYNAHVEEVFIEVLENSFEVVSMKSNYEFDKLIKGVSDETLFEQALEIQVEINGEPYTGTFTAVSSKPTVAILENGQIKVLNYGVAELEIYADGIFAGIVNVDAKVYDKGIYTKADLESIRTSASTLSMNYILMADIDGQGKIESIAHYTASSTLNFTGIFEGNGHTIYNFAAVYNGNLTQGNSSLFGQVGSTAIIRNLNLINVEVANRIGGGLATINRGLIENVFVQAHFTWHATTDHNNPMGGIVSKNYGIIRNSIAVVTLKEGISNVNIGGIAGRTYAGSTTENVYAITSLDVVESATPTNEGNHQKLGIHTNTAAFVNLETFYANANLSVFNENWTFASGYMPFYGNNMSVQVLNTDFTAYKGSLFTVQISPAFGYNVTLAEAIEGVTIEGNRVYIPNELTVSSIPLIVTNQFGDKIESISIEILESNVEVVALDTEYSFSKLIKNDSPETLFTQTIEAQIIFNGVVFTGELTGISADPVIAIIENGQIKALGYGSTTIELFAYGVSVGTILVSSEVYDKGIYTKADLEAVRSNLNMNYILMADIDGQGKIESIAHYSSSSTNHFQGIFEGNGHTIYNFSAAYNGNLTAGNSSLFGQIGTNGVVRNLNIIKVAVVNRIAGGLATVNRGLIENVFVQVHFNVNRTTDENNPMGGVVAKNYGTIRNTIAVVSLEPGIASKNIGGIAGRTYNFNGISSLTENNYAITSLGVVEEAVPTNEGGGPAAGTHINNATFATLEAFYAEANLEVFNASWQFIPGFYPVFKEHSFSYEFAQDYQEAFIGTSMNLLVNAHFAYTMELVNPVTGVTLVGNNLTLSNEVEPETEIVIRLVGLFPSDEHVLHITAKVNKIELVNATTNYDFTYILGVDEVVRSIDATVMKNEQPWTGQLTGVSANSDVAIVENGQIKLVGHGITSIDLFAEGVPLTSINVKATQYLPVNTTTDFLAIGATAASMAKNYILMADLDFENATINAFSNYASATGVDAKGFKGIFDGNGHTISNLEPLGVGTHADKSIFGYLFAGSVVRNLNLRGVILNGRVGVISSFSLGLIENITIEAIVPDGGVFGDTSSNPGGVVVSKSQAGSTLRNIVVHLTFAGTYQLKVAGGILGLSNGTISNLHLITTDVALPVRSGGSVEPTNAFKYADLTALYLSETKDLLVNFELAEGIMPKAPISTVIFN